MKKTLIFVALFLALAICAFLGWLRFGSSGYIAILLENAIQEATGAPLEMKKKPEMSIFPPKLALSELYWENPEHTQRVSISGVTLSPDIFPLFLGQFLFKEIVVESPVANFLFNDSSSERHATETDSSFSSKFPVKISLPGVEKLIIHKGNIGIKLPNGEILFSDANFQGDNLRNRQEALLSGDFILKSELDGQAGKKSRLSGNVAFRGRARFYEPNLTLRQASVSFTATEGEALTWMSPMQLNMEGAYNFENREIRLNSAVISLAPGKLMARGIINVSEMEWEGDGTLELDLNKILGESSGSVNTESRSLLIINSPFRFKDAIFDLKEVAIKGKETEGAGQLVFSLPEDGRLAAIEGNLTFRRLNILPSSAEKTKMAQKSDSLHNMPPYSVFPRLNLKLKANQFMYGNFSASDAMMELQGESGVYEVRNAAMAWADGNLEAEISANLPKNYFNVKASGQNINAGLALKETGFKGFTGGVADFKADLSSHGLDFDAIRATLQGSVQFAATNVRIDLLQKIAAFLPSDNAFRKNFPDAVQLFSASIAAAKGQMEIDPLKFEAKNLLATGKGKYLLSTGRIDGDLIFRLGSFSLPLKFNGPANDISWSMGGGFLRQLLKDLP